MPRLLTISLEAVALTNRPKLTGSENHVRKILATNTKFEKCLLRLLEKPICTYGLRGAPPLALCPPSIPLEGPTNKNGGRVKLARALSVAQTVI